MHGYALVVIVSHCHIYSLVSTIKALEALHHAFCLCLGYALPSLYFINQPAAGQRRICHLLLLNIEKTKNDKETYKKDIIRQIINCATRQQIHINATDIDSRLLY